MTGFDERERAFEAQFAHAEETKFLLRARRDKLFARWAAASLGLNEADTGALVAAVVHIPDRAGHDGLLIGQIKAVLSASNLTLTEADLSDMLRQCGEQAATQLGM